MKPGVALVVMSVFLLFGPLYAQDSENILRITSGPRVEHVDSDSAVIAWSTNASSGTLLRYGTEPDKLTETREMPWGALTHRVTLKNLRPTTTYYFQAVSVQGQGTGTSTSSAVFQFRTKASADKNAAATELP